MTCYRCLRELEDESSFCRFCGARLDESASGPRRLTRLPDDGHVAGVCAGLAAWFDADVTLIRLAVAALAVVPGLLLGGLLAYAIAWALIPAAEPGERLAYTGTRLVRSGTNRFLAGVCGGLAEYLRLDATIVRVVAAILAVYPGALVGGLIVYAVAWIIIPDSPVTVEEAAPTA